MVIALTGFSAIAQQQMFSPASVQKPYVGLAIALGCLAISHYVMGFHTGIADNISGNGVGLVLGTMFRFWAYRRWVFPEAAIEAADQVTATTAI